MDASERDLPWHAIHARAAELSRRQLDSFDPSGASHNIQGVRFQPREVVMAFVDRKRWLRSRALSDSDSQFLINCLTARGIGMWAAGILGLEGEQAARYAQELVLETLLPGEMNFALRLQCDFQARGISVSDHRIEAALERQKEYSAERVAHRFWNANLDPESGWERRRRPRMVPPPVVLSPALQEWKRRHNQEA